MCVLLWVVSKQCILKIDTEKIHINTKITDDTEIYYSRDSLMDRSTYFVSQV